MKGRQTMRGCYEEDLCWNTMREYCEEREYKERQLTRECYKGRVYYDKLL